MVTPEKAWKSLKKIEKDWKIFKTLNFDIVENILNEKKFKRAWYFEWVELVASRGFRLQLKTTECKKQTVTSHCEGLFRALTQAGLRGLYCFIYKLFQPVFSVKHVNVIRYSEGWLIFDQVWSISPAA